MNDNRSKRILDSTFEHLEKAIEERRRDKDTRKKKIAKVSKQKGGETQNTDSDKSESVFSDRVQIKDYL
jgi:hypothetical protein